MKENQSAIQVMETLTDFMINAYSTLDIKVEGSIQFFLTHEGKKANCYLKTDLEKMTFSEGIISNPTVSIHSTLYYWLDLAAKRLNPVMGVITKKLKFEGDTSFISKAIPKNTFDIDISEFEDPVTDFEREPQKHWKTPSKILVINASPRGKHGYTYYYLQPFIEGLKSAGSDVEVINIHKMTIKPCTGCWQCWLSGTGKCVIDDDVEEILEKRTQADLIVYAFPLYSMSVPGILKNLNDRSVVTMHPFMIDGLHETRHPRRNIKNQATVLFSICGFMDFDHFNALRALYKERSIHGHSPLVAEILRPACMYLYNNPLNFQTLNSVLDALKKAGKQVVLNGKVEKKTLKQISQKAGSDKQFQDSANAFWFIQMKQGRKTY